jgi:hypothetical protein
MLGRDVIRQVDQNFQARRDAKSPPAIGAAQYIGAVIAAGIDAVLILQAADRHHDGRIGHVGPIGFDRSIWLRALCRRRGGPDTGQGCSNERCKLKRPYRRCPPGFNSFHHVSAKGSAGHCLVRRTIIKDRIGCRLFAERRFISGTLYQPGSALHRSLIATGEIYSRKTRPNL